ncbi:MAG: hypothetical protein Q8P27_03140 [Candidatus Peregrinibacteria bacterium]|nr:hypothetical protein [Candidatus Peregrinibacteria bacterium]
MGAGREKRGMHEIDSTKQSASEDRFEEIMEKVKAAGADIKRDEDLPLHDSMGEFEIGEKRVVEFNLAKFDFEITREVKDYMVSGGGHQKSLTELAAPRIDIRLKRKPENSDQWVIVDLEDFM